MGVKQILVIFAVVVLVGCGKDTPETSQTAEAEPQIASKRTPEPESAPPADEKLIADPFVEKAVRKSLEKPEGELTVADLEKVTSLRLPFRQITDVGLKEVAKLQNLQELYLPSQITDEGLKEVAKLQNLTGLNLMACKQITDAGLKEVAKLQKLERLSLLGTKITDAGVAELRKALPKCFISGP